LEHAYEQYEKNLLNFCLSKNIRREDAEDVVHDTFIRTYEFLHNGGEVKQLNQFLFTVANNLIIDLARKQNNRQRKEVSLDVLLENGFEVGDDTKDTIMNRKLDVKNILSSRSQVKKKDYQLLVLRYIRGMSPSEIATKTGLTSNAVSIRLHRVTKNILCKVC
jgi:RNA polymerase sigma-70 factor (ECF subfamily)